MENPSRLLEIHQTLADINHRFIAQTTRSDRMRYLREYIYHYAQSPSQITDLNHILQDFVRPILLEEVNEIRVQFREELDQDPDLKIILGDYFNILRNMTEDSIAKDK